MNSVKNCKIIDLPKINNGSGNLTAINGLEDIPFSIKRIYYLYDVPGGEERGGHAHRSLEQYIIAASGSFEVIINDGNEKVSYFLNRPFKALHIVPGIWRELKNFSSGSICLVLASHEFDESDYIRKFQNYLRIYG